MSLRSTAIVGLRWTLGARVGLQLLSWPLTLVTMRMLEPRDYGLLAVSMFVLGLLALFGDLGLGVTLVQQRRLSRQAAGQATGLIVGMHAVLAVALYGAAPLVASLFGEPDLAAMLQWLCLSLFLGGVAIVPELHMERRLRFRRLSIALILSGLCGAVAALLAAWFDMGYWSLVIGQVATAGTRLVLQLALCGPLAPPRLSLSLAELQPQLLRGRHVLGSRALWHWYTQADQLILARLLHPAALGQFSVANQLATLPVSKAMDTINRVAVPTLARAHAQKVMPESVYLPLLGMTAFYAVGVCWGLAAIAGLLVQVILGPPWEDAGTVLGLLATIAPLKMMGAMHNTLATSVGRPDVVTKELTFAAVVLPTAVAFGAWQAGVVGAAMAWVAAYPLVYLVSAALTMRAIGLTTWAGVSTLVVPLAAGCGMSATVIWTGRTLVEHLNPLVLLAVLIAAGAAAYLAMVRLIAPELLRDARVHAREFSGRRRPGPA